MTIQVVGGMGGQCEVLAVPFLGQNEIIKNK
jgi:hypothetical protein